MHVSFDSPRQVMIIRNSIFLRILSSGWGVEGFGFLTFQGACLGKFWHSKASVSHYLYPRQVSVSTFAKWKNNPPYSLPPKAPMVAQFHHVFAGSSPSSKPYVRLQFFWEALLRFPKVISQ